MTKSHLKNNELPLRSVRTALVLLLFLWGIVQLTATSVRAQEFSAMLNPTEPTPANTWFQSKALFFLRPDNIVEFYIRFGYEAIFPSRALILADSEQFIFDLGPGLIIVHSPGPWPDGYDGATQFTGSFALVDNLIKEFRMGQSTLRLEGTEVGDFTGSIVQVPEPSNAAIGIVAISFVGVVCWRRRTAKITSTLRRNATTSY